MTVLGAERERRAIRPLEAVERWVFVTSPVWLLTLITLTAATLVHGYESARINDIVWIAKDPWHLDPAVAAYGYQSPLGPMIAWALNWSTTPGVALTHYLVTVTCVVLATLAVARWASDIAARLFLCAYFCSPQSWAATAYLGLFDIITVAGITVAAVAPFGVSLAAGVVIGFNHFEQAGFALIAVAVIRVVLRRESWKPIAGAFLGLVAGKLLLLGYQVACGLPTNGRAEFIQQHGLADIVGGWTGSIPQVLWAVYNVLWVGMVWMAWTMPNRDRWIAVGLHVFLTLPVLITYDLSRVYRTVTWPLVMLLVLYAAEHRSQPMVRRAALALVALAVFVPRTEIWHGGLVIN